MKKLKVTGIVIAVCIIALAALAAGLVRYMGTPTSGEKIRAYDRPARALLVIDIQEDFTGTTARREMYPKADIEPAIATVNSVIEKAQKRKWLIVYIRQEFKGVPAIISKVFLGGVAINGTPGAQVDKRVAIRSDHILTKPIGDSFSNPALGALLVKNRVNELFLTGLDAEHCVHNTAQGALNRGYGVTIVTDAILLGAKEKWNGLLEEYKKEGIHLIQNTDL